MDFSVALKNGRWERFAQLCLEQWASDAFRAVYPVSVKWKVATVHKRSGELAGKAVVKGRVAWLTEQAAERAVVSKERVLKEWASLAFMPLSKDGAHVAAKTKALDALSKHLGFYDADNSGNMAVDGLTQLLAEIGGRGRG